VPRHAQGSLIGYAPSGLPLYDLKNSAWSNVAAVVRFARTVIRVIFDHPDTRRLFYFLCVNVAFMLVEMVVGVWTNSLGLLTDSLHNLFENTAVSIGLFAGIATKWKASRAAPFGYGRLEVLGRYLNALVSAIIAANIGIEAVLRSHAPPEVKTGGLVLISVGSFALSIISMVSFRQINKHRGALSSLDTGDALGDGTPRTPARGNSSASRSSFNDSFALEGGERAVRARHKAGDDSYLSRTAGIIGSTAILGSSMMIDQYGTKVIDPICAMLVAVVIFIRVTPLIQQSTAVLLDRTPRLLSEGKLADALVWISNLEGVIGCRDVHMWSHTGAGAMGSLHVVVVPGANQQRILGQVTAFLKDKGVAPLTVQVEAQGVRFTTRRSSQQSSDATMITANQHNLLEGALSDVKSI